MSRRPLRLPPPWTLIIVGLALYAFTLPFEFVFDDHIYLVNNPLVRDTQSLWFMGDFHAFANHAKKLGLEPDLSTNFILRPFAYLTFHLNYLLDGMNPPGFRAVNIAIHCANALLLLALVRGLFRHATKGGHTEDSGAFIATGAAFLFLVHPLQIESVTYVVQRFTSLGTSFYLFVILTFVNARAATSEAAGRVWRRWSIAGLLVGIFTKEFLFTAPFVMVILDWIYFGTRLRAAIRRILPWCVALPIIPILILLISAAQSERGLTFSGALNVAGTKDGGDDYAWHYTLTQPGVVLTYLRLLILPTGLNVDPDRPPCTALLDWRVMGPLLVMLAILAGAVRWHVARREDSRRALVLCGVLWFFLTVSVDSSFVPLPDLMAEHRTYLPSVGMLIAFVCLADTARTSLSRWPHLRLAVPGIVGCAVVALSVATIQRNEVWRSNISFWSDTVAKSPNKWRPWKNLGVSYIRDNQFEKAIGCYRRAIEIEPKTLEAYFGLANAMVACNRFREGLEVAEAGLRVKGHPGLYYLQGISLWKIGEEQRAAESLMKAVALAPAHGPSHVALASIFAKRGDFIRAAAHARTAATADGLTEPMWRILSEVEATTRIRITSP